MSILFAANAFAAPNPINCYGDNCAAVPADQTVINTGYKNDPFNNKLSGSSGAIGAYTKPVSADGKSLSFRSVTPVGIDPGASKREDPKPNDNAKPDCTNPATEQPVIIATGEKIKREIDFESTSLYGLSHVRTYRSAASTNYTGMFGPNWSSNLSFPKMIATGCNRTADWGCVPTTVQVFSPDQSSIVYKYIAGTDSPFLYTSIGSISAGTLEYYPNYSWTLKRNQH